MSESKHTPGPWVGFVAGDHLTIHPAGTVGQIALVTGENWNADGHLLTAAPDLYAALRRARGMLQSIAGDIEDGHSLAGMREKYTLAVLRARDDADAALAKANGEVS